MEQQYKLGKFSYSRLNTFIQCPMKYKLKYINGNYVQSSMIHLDLGNILHKGLELKYRGIIDGKPLRYTQIKHMIIEGVTEETEKDKGNHIKGLKEIKEYYGNGAFTNVDLKSGLSYEDKLSNFFYQLENETLNNDWKPFAVEFPFEFVFEDRVVFHGFIDRIDINNNGDYRVVDYKSSNKVFDKKDLTTPLQMMIYALAIQKTFGRVPIEYQYDMIMLKEKQDACTKGFYDRGVKKIHKVLDEIEECMKRNEWKPKATPLCHWCDYSESNPSAKDDTKDMCQYYSLWTPSHKTFQTNKEFISNKNEKGEWVF